MFHCFHSLGDQGGGQRNGGDTGSDEGLFSADMDFFHETIPPKIFEMVTARKPRDKNGAIGRDACDAFCGSSLRSRLMSWFMR